MLTRYEAARCSPGLWAVSRTFNTSSGLVRGIKIAYPWIPSTDTRVAFSGLRAYALSRHRLLSAFVFLLMLVPAGINYGVSTSQRLSHSSSWLITYGIALPTVARYNSHRDSLEKTSPSWVVYQTQACPVYLPDSECDMPTLV